MKNRLNFQLFSLSVISLLISVPVFSQTIEEKLLSMESDQTRSKENWNSDLVSANEAIAKLKQELSQKYIEAQNFSHDAEKSHKYLSEIAEIKNKIFLHEDTWYKQAIKESKKEDEAYSFWDQEETNLSQLVMEYGASDFLYVIPPEMANMKLHLHSTVPIPRESWDDLLEAILESNGIGVKKVNAYTKQLYLLKKNLTAVEAVLTAEPDLSGIPPGMRIAFVFSPVSEQVKRVTHFFERFCDHKRTFVYQVGNKVALISSKEEVKKLLSLYNAVWEEQGEKVTKVLPLQKLPPLEMEKILKAFFGNIKAQSRLAIARGEGEDLTIFTLKEEGAIVLVGLKDLVEKAEKIVFDTEKQIEDPCEMTVYWYKCRHSDPIDISDVLEKVYTTLTCGVPGSGTEEVQKTKKPSIPKFEPPTYGPPPTPPVVHPPVVTATTAAAQKQTSATLNFIPYPKTGAVMMVVRRDTLPKIKELIKILDVPKKMVQMEVLLFEKRLTNQNNFGLNLLKLGDAAKNVHETGLKYENSPPETMGILEFFISRTKSSHFPAFDLAYNFLMSQDDIRINASPTITTLNQTPAQISIVDEISINNGAAPLETQTGITFEKSFSRAQYGITIVMTPTIHEKDPFNPDDKRFVTLETNITFDTTKTDANDRPNVNRRHIENQVRVMDGETIIIGGLQRKRGEDKTEKIPFLGEIPGIAKFFGTSKMLDEKTEMFFFITPKVIEDSEDELIKLRTEQLMKRPGDLPEFLERALQAKKDKKQKVFENSLKLLFGNVDDNT